MRHDAPLQREARVTENANHSSITELLETYVDSIEGLEALLLLRRNFGKSLTAEDVAGGLRLPAQHLDDALHRLERGGLVERTELAGVAAYTYNPKDAQLADTVDSLASAYADSPVEIVRMLSVRALERVRTEAARLFADAFVLGRKKDG